MSRAVFVLLAVGALGYYGRQAYTDDLNGKASLTWKPVPAKILANQLSQRPWTRGFHLDFKYIYTVKHETYTSDRISYPDWRSGSDVELARFPVQSIVTAYYNPDMPSQSVLVRSVNQRGAETGRTMLWLTGALVLLTSFAPIKQK